MTWTVEDSAIMLQAIAGYDPKDPTSSRAPVPDYSESLIDDIEGMRIGVPRHFFFADDPTIDKDTLAAVDNALATLEDMGAHVEEVSVPMLEHRRRGAAGHNAQRGVRLPPEQSARHARAVRRDGTRAIPHGRAVLRRRLCTGAASPQCAQARIRRSAAKLSMSSRRPRCPTRRRASTRWTP